MRGYSFNPITIDTILAVLELKYDLDEDRQVSKQALIRILLKMNNRMLIKDYVEKLGAEQESMEKMKDVLTPIISRRRAQTALKTKQPNFDRMSKNALQNVMSYFDYKG